LKTFDTNFTVRENTIYPQGISPIFQFNMNQKGIIWLVSWYPNEKNPVAGDFIQRHAQAVSKYRNLTVIYMDQSGWKENSILNKTEITTSGNLTEIRCYLPFHKTGISMVDLLLFNQKYHLRYKRLLKKVFRENGYPELIHVHVPMKAGKLAVWAKRKWGIPFILSEQASTYLESAPDYFERRSIYYRHSVKKIFKEAIAVTNVSKTVARMLENTMGRNDIRVIHNTIDERLFFHTPDVHHTFRFIHVSTMNEQKNIRGLLNAFKLFSTIRSDWELRLVGPISASLQKRVELLKKGFTITCTGEIPYRQVALEMQQASAFVLFSNHENFPCVIAEALACGLPVITSDAGGSGECINMNNGKIVPVGNEEKLLQALNEVLDKYHDYNRYQIAQEAACKFSYPVIGQQFSRLYDEILQRWA
jgi:glycosyltransferase involved in cell wall biosynthesis